MPYIVNTILLMIMFAIVERNNSLEKFFHISSVDLTGILEDIKSFNFRNPLSVSGPNATIRCAMQCVSLGNCNSFEVCIRNDDNACNLMRSTSTLPTLYNVSMDCVVYTQVNEMIFSSLIWNIFLHTRIQTLLVETFQHSMWLVVNILSKQKWLMKTIDDCKIVPLSRYLIHVFVEL